MYVKVIIKQDKYNKSFLETQQRSVFVQSITFIKTLIIIYKYYILYHICNLNAYIKYNKLVNIEK